ncbi:hypothetical protein EVAR_22357_1 [Eumeta japonica]|uniref:Uncharacterized protein n=1 Tax=Eumeta variegata TaxID=151549 RepID=A0A4C1VHZ2_EUMVA|nr:hypothetical protein EVAR_22357_1 [Eumeta japonica]
MILRNLNPPRLCNGTRLSVKRLMPNLIEATIINGKYAAIWLGGTADALAVVMSSAPIMLNENVRTGMAMTSKLLQT